VSGGWETTKGATAAAVTGAGAGLTVAGAGIVTGGGAGAYTRSLHSST